ADDIGWRGVGLPLLASLNEVCDELGPGHGELRTVVEGGGGEIELTDHPGELELRSTPAGRGIAAHPEPEVTHPEEGVRAVQEAHRGARIVPPRRVVAVLA